jgi:hypothetical protein
MRCLTGDAHGNLYSLMSVFTLRAFQVYVRHSRQAVPLPQCPHAAPLARALQPVTHARLLVAKRGAHLGRSGTWSGTRTVTPRPRAMRSNDIPASSDGSAAPEHAVLRQQLRPCCKHDTFHMTKAHLHERAARGSSTRAVPARHLAEVPRACHWPPAASPLHQLAPCGSTPVSVMTPHRSAGQQLYVHAGGLRDQPVQATRRRGDCQLKLHSAHLSGPRAFRAAGMPPARALVCGTQAHVASSLE